MINRIYQDINLNDRMTRDELLEYWADNDVDNMTTIFTDNADKAMVADMFNDITEAINDIEDNISRFKTNRIKLDSTLGITTGQVYFQTVLS